MKTTLPLALGIFALTNLSGLAQDAPAAPAAASGPAAGDATPVPVGKGSYASSIPSYTNPKAASFDAGVTPFLKPDDDRPVPSNHWDNSVFYRPFAVGLWSYPSRVDSNAKGFLFYYETAWKPDGAEMGTDNPIAIGAKDFQATGTKAKDWSDWLTSFRLAQSDDKYFDATVGEGMPYLWLECHGVSPTISYGDGKAPSAGGTTYFGPGGAPATLPVTGDAIGITYAGRNYAVFAPDGTKFEGDATTINVTFSGDKQFLVVCPLPTAKDIDTFHKYAFAVPRNTRLSWKYDADAGTITTDWKITTELLKGTESAIIQGWIPHHYRTNLGKLDFNGIEYPTTRGQMKCTVGNDFTLSYAYGGLLPNLPAPKSIGGDHDFDPNRLKTQLAAMAAKVGFASDTYAGGKDLTRNAQAACIARQTGDPSAPVLTDAVIKQLINWYTFTPGEKDHYFAYYPHKKGMVGFNSSFGSETFTDNHFHLGYFTYATGLIAMQDPGFLKDYGDMATLVAKQYANWDHDDKRFPFLRTFDVWAGHSWAGGNGTPDGVDNQESSSEATNSWAGLILLGEATGNKDMTSTGIMGYTFESHATLEYWFNEYGDNFPPEWKHPICGMIWSNHLVWGTWFTGDNEWFYGIQWIPTAPTLTYFVHDPVWAKKNFENLVQAKLNQPQKKPKTAPAPPPPDPNATTASAAPAPAAAPAAPVDPIKWDGELGTYMLGYVMMYDPAFVVAKLDELSSDATPWQTNVYYQAHSMMNIGRVDFTAHGNDATSMVYVNDATKTRTYIVWNPSIAPETVQFFEGTKPLGMLVAGPQTITSATTLAK
jgi:endoglucanase Acf2